MFIASISMPVFFNAELWNRAEKVKISDFCMEVTYVNSLYVSNKAGESCCYNDDAVSELSLWTIIWILNCYDYCAFFPHWY